MDTWVPKKTMSDEEQMLGKSMNIKKWVRKNKGTPYKSSLFSLWILLVGSQKNLLFSFTKIDTTQH